MDRVTVYPGAIPQDLDLLNTNKNAMVGLGYLAQAILGTNTVVDGLACTPTGPATMTVNVAGGSIYTLAQVDATAYGSIGSDTVNQVVKQGIVVGTTNFACPAPATTGQSVVYLIQAQFQEADGGSQVLPYYNASNPSVPYSGPGNAGTANYTLRQDKCILAKKTGTAATTGTQATPTPDAGYVALWAITVANGATTVTSGNIAQVSTAPFFAKLPSLIQKRPTFTNLTSSSGTYTTPAGATRLRVRMVAGGGSGLGYNSGTTPVAGNAGTNSAFGSTTAVGGGGVTGQAGGTGGTGGGSGTGTVTFRMKGNNGTDSGAGGGVIGSGAGAAGIFGGSGRASGGADNSGGNAAANSGAGGGGASGDSGGNGGGGGAGEYVEFYVDSPAATYSYTVGAGGASTGTTYAGGAGGSGIILIEEQY